MSVCDKEGPCAAFRDPRLMHAAEYGVVFDYIRDSWGMSADTTKPSCLREFK